jgi:prolyl oligopeptidase
MAAADAQEDEFLWLEEIEGERALAWVHEQNENTLARLTAHPEYEAIYQDSLKDLTQSDRLPTLQIIGDHAYDLLQDADHVRGLLRRMPLSDLLDGGTRWEPVLDIDALGKAEGQSWVFKGATCLEPEQDRCMLILSPGGSDASAYREFDLASKSFVEGGFATPVLKANISWMDADTLLISAALDDDNSTLSGYGNRVRQWARGTKLEDAPVLFTIPDEHMAVWGNTIVDGEERYHLLADLETIFDHRQHLLREDGTVVKLPLEDDFEFGGISGGRIFGRQKGDWVQNGVRFKAGSLLSFPLAPMLDSGKLPPAEVLFEPTDSQAVSVMLGSGMVATRDSVYFAITDHVVGKLMRARRENGGWKVSTVALPDNGAVSIVAGSKDAGLIIVQYENLIRPPSLYAVGDDRDPAEFASLEPKFNPDDYETVQHFAVSEDGTRVPYFVVKPKNLVLDGNAPALIGAYGGFGLTIKPGYMGFFGSGAPFKTIIGHGGVYVSANIRGGGEYGPAWHQGAIKENRQRVYEDFFAVAEDLIERGYTSTRRLGIAGASNSGLLVGVSITQRPDLYTAALCGVPLLDMRRYHKLLAGQSWMAEYGDPDDPEQWKFIQGFSPYHNIDPDTEYPEVMFWGSTKDDRVHPGHARKMAARMMAQGHPVLFYEETEGGHGSADLNQKARVDALKAVYLLDKLQ